jgi:hypothetical protein
MDPQQESNLEEAGGLGLGHAGFRVACMGICRDTVDVKECEKAQEGALR